MIQAKIVIWVHTDKDILKGPAGETAGNIESRLSAEDVKTVQNYCMNNLPSTLSH